MAFGNEAFVKIFGCRKGEIAEKGMIKIYDKGLNNFTFLLKIE